MVDAFFFSDHNFYVFCFCFFFHIYFFLPSMVLWRIRIRVIRHHRHHYLMSLFLIDGLRAHSQSSSSSLHPPYPKLKPQTRNRHEPKEFQEKKSIPIQLAAWLRFCQNKRRKHMHTNVPIAFRWAFNWRST